MPDAARRTFEMPENVPVVSTSGVSRSSSGGPESLLVSLADVGLGNKV